MRLLGQAGGPAARTMARRAADVALAALAWASAVPVLYQGGAHPPAVKVVALALMAAPLAARRAWPLPVFAWTLGTAAAAVAWDPRMVDGLALLVSLYTVAALRPYKEALACAGLLEVASVAALAAFAGGSWWFDAIFLSGMVAAALGLGLYSAARRAYLAGLRDRAARLERERDQQAALAVAAERARIAREMHDIVAHNLTVMVTLSEAAAAASPAGPDRAAELMRTVAATGRAALTDTRRVLGVLRQPPGRDPGETLLPLPGLADLDALIGQVRAAGLDITLEIRGRPGVPPAGVQLAVFRLVQESLTNTLRHAGVSARACVRLAFAPGELRVSVEDDGAGQPAAVPAGAGGGLPGMRERIRAYGGDMHAGPRRPAGWTVSARLPFEEEERP